MKRWLPFILPVLLAVSALAYAPAPNRTLTLAWVARGRLHAVTERDASNSGYNWTAVYDGLNRRLSTTTVLVTNGVASTAPAQTINAYFDPQVEFLELGVSYGDQTVWKLYGPDLNGKYGGLNGTGGLDGVSPYLDFFYPTISDFRGNVLAEVTNGVVAWNPARPTGYGAVPGYRPAVFANGADMAQSSAWRGHWVDITGYHQIGLRPYDPMSGRWLTYDSVWNARDPNYYTFCGGDPINSFDADGRISRALYNWGGNAINGVGNLVNNTYYSVSYGVSALAYGTDQANQWYGQNLQGFQNTITGTAQIAYDVSAMATYGLISPFAPDFAYNNYGGSMQQLLGQEAPAFYGGNNQSLAYQITYGSLSLATLFIGGEAGEAGNLAKVGTVADGSAYSVAYQMTLDTADLGKSRSVQFNRANAALDSALQSDSAFASQMEQLIPDVGNSVSSVGGRETPSGWIWHHDEGPGIMQLVPEVQHTPGSIFWDTLHPAPGGAGGYSIWAIPAGAPPN